MQMLERNYVGRVMNAPIIIDKIYSIHYFEYVKNFKGLLERHDFWEMVYVDCGSIVVIEGDKRLPLKHGEACFHKPLAPHNIESARDYSSVFIISFSTSSPDAQLFEHLIAGLSPLARRIISTILSEYPLSFAGALDIMDQTELVRLSRPAYGGEQVIRSMLEYLLIDIVRNSIDWREKFARDPLAVDEDGQRIVNDVVAILTRNVYGRIALDEICQELSFSKSYICMKFKQRMGCGVIHYFDILKINEAKRLISEGELTFTNIAERLNFCSIHYFSRSFKTITGMNPSEYARSVKSRGLL